MADRIVFLGSCNSVTPADPLKSEDAKMTDVQRHFARTLPYDELLAGLEAAQAEQAVYDKIDPATGLQLWAYTSSCVYDRKWSVFSRHARGLILDPAERRVVATPFPKFFNLGETDDALPSEPFEVFEKVDGSLIVLFHFAGQWRASTRGAFGTEQAVWAERWMGDFDLSPLEIGHTYLAEAVYPENRIVIPYDEQGLVLLSAYDAHGFELDRGVLQQTADSLGWRLARRHVFDSFDDMAAQAKSLPEHDEGYVVRFASGYRVKVKSPAYCQLHALIHRVTPLGLWDLLADGEDTQAVRRRLPEELWDDFDAILQVLQQAIDDSIAEVGQFAASVAHLEDKDVGKMREEIPPSIFAKLFFYRRNPDLRSDRRAFEKILREIKPKGNVLPGYTPSATLTRMVGDAE